MSGTVTSTTSARAATHAAGPPRAPRRLLDRSWRAATSPAPSCRSALPAPPRCHPLLRRRRREGFFRRCQYRTTDSTCCWRCWWASAGMKLLIINTAMNSASPIFGLWAPLALVSVICGGSQSSGSRWSHVAPVDYWPPTRVWGRASPHAGGEIASPATHLPTPHGARNRPGRSRRLPSSARGRGRRASRRAIMSGVIANSGPIDDTFSTWTRSCDVIAELAGARGYTKSSISARSSTPTR